MAYVCQLRHFSFIRLKVYTAHILRIAEQLAQMTFAASVFGTFAGLLQDFRGMTCLTSNLKSSPQ